ncbi:hypothetical protein H9Q74_011014 [Fusarium xylarioides]|nr:hypothetical protein H9Q71_011231 [Fusarium xylarioides]KAG5816675.1 hypothetical protein H9Q74_011014 [Fusarium xylarioides]
MNHFAAELPDTSIERWLDTVIKESPRKTGSTTAHCNANLASSLFDNMPTPPASDSTPTQGSQRSPKRPRRDDGSTSQFDQGFADESPFSDIETPTGPQRTNTLPAMNLPAHPRLRQTPSLSSTSSTRSSKARSTSPVKRSTLQLLRKPVLFVPIDQDPSAQLANDILPTYDRIIDITTYNSFLPRAIEHDIKATHRRNTVKPHWFLDDAHDEATIAKDMQELAALREVEKAAKACQTEESSEAAWNVDVHAPLLKLALAPFPSLTRDILTHARISKPFVPEMQANSYYNLTASKMIDWAIRVRPSPNISEQIRKVLSGLPDDQRSINQTTYGPVRFDPIAVSIETKIAIGAIEEARLQLGLWVAAWHQRVSALSQSVGSGHIITLPLILVMEHEWHLLLACDRGDRIEIIEGIAIGDTRGLIGLLALQPTSGSCEVLQYLKSIQSEHPGREQIRLLENHFTIQGSCGPRIVFVLPPLVSVKLLQELQPRSVYDEETAVSAIQRTVLALNFLHHEASVIHTGKSSGTVIIHVSQMLLAAGGPPHLCDFGHARICPDSELQTGLIMPTQYRAPEVLLDMQWDFTVDLWSIGILMWDLLEPKGLFQIYDPNNLEINEAFHLAHMVRILGPTPLDFLQRSPKAQRYWDDVGNWKGVVPRRRRWSLSSHH